MILNVITPLGIFTLPLIDCIPQGPSPALQCLPSLTPARFLEESLAWEASDSLVRDDTNRPKKCNTAIPKKMVFLSQTVKLSETLLTVLWLVTDVTDKRSVALRRPQNPNRNRARKDQRIHFEILGLCSKGAHNDITDALKPVCQLRYTSLPVNKVFQRLFRAHSTTNVPLQLFDS